MGECSDASVSVLRFSLDRSMEILGRTPTVLRSLLKGLAEEWIRGNEGPGTWSPFDVVGHLIHADKTNWISRARIILGDGPKAFEPFDREAMQKSDQKRSLADLLDEFARARTDSLAILVGMRIGEAELARTGVHPDLGEITLRQLLATWTVHDLDHLHQISRVMAKLYAAEVGPWKGFLRVLREGTPISSSSRKKRGGAR
jgi:hypothetical protein